MAKLDLRPEWLETVQRLIAQHVPDAEVLAYGSRVNGSSHDGSDLDLAVRDPVDPLKPVLGVDSLRQALSDSDLPILVDVVNWASIPDTFREEIKKSYVIQIYKPKMFRASSN